MSTLIFLLLVAAAVYVLWFHKFTLPDGTEIKGWLAKNKAEKGNAPAAPATNAAHLRPREKSTDGRLSRAVATSSAYIYLSVLPRLQHLAITGAKLSGNVICRNTSPNE